MPEYPGTQRLLQHSPRFRDLPVPHGKDISDFYLDGGDLYAWVAAVLDEKQTMLEEIPHAR